MYIALAIDLYDLRPNIVAIRGRGLSSQGERGGACWGKGVELFLCQIFYSTFILFFSSFFAFGGF